MSQQRSSSRSSLWPFVLIGIGLLVLAGAGALYFTTSQPDPTPTPARFLPAEETYPEIPRVKLVDAKTAHDAGTAVFVDVRDASSYANAHVKGALSLPLIELDKRKGELKPSDWIITYCT